MHMKCQIADDIAFPLSKMMRVINKVLPLSNADPNIVEREEDSALRVFRYTFQNRTRRYFFWVTANVEVMPSAPSKGNASSWEQDSVLTRLLSRSSSALGVQPIILNLTCEDDASTMHSSTAGIVPEREAKRQKTATDNGGSVGVICATAAGEDEQEVVVRASYNGGWWASGDARQLFAPCNTVYDKECDVKEIVMERIEMLEAVNRSPSSWKTVIDTRSTSSTLDSGAKRHSYSETDAFSLRYRSMYLALALKQFVLNVTDNLKTQWTWKRCLKFAIEAMNDVGVEYYSNFETLRLWHRKFARNRYFYYKTPEPKTLYPAFFVENPDAMEAFKKYGVAHIKDLRVEMMLEYVHQELIPKLMLKREGSGLFDDNGDEAADVLVGVSADKVVAPQPPTNKASFLQSYGLSTISIATMARWMHACGFRYKKREKHYFVDGHERPETIAYRPVFTKKYLAYEVRAHRWIQITLDESNALVLEGNITADSGYCYKTDDGIDMVEYHVDASYIFDERLSLLPFGGNLSIRKPVDSRAVIFVGQDEAIFKQFLFLMKMWVGPNGERPLLPKDEGTGTMISTFICREHGLIREISPEILAEVNLKRDGEKYADREAATEMQGNPDKKPLTLDKSPFLVFFEYGENREGYWAYNNMVLQFEDAVDVLKVMHPEFDFVFLFDHSAGHARQRPDGLNQHRMNRAFGGKAVTMRDTLIQQEEGFLGQFPRILQPGDVQSLVFLPGSDAGPFWMSDVEREDSRRDTHLGTTSAVKLAIPELILQLRENGVEDSLAKKTIRQLRNLCTQHGLLTHKMVAIVHERNRSELEISLKGIGISTKGKNKRELVALCEQNQIATTKNVERIKEGWEGKPKGLLQVLWERGLIDGNNLKSYALTGRKDHLKVRFGHIVI
jgi:hypothetical protein